MQNVLEGNKLIAAFMGYTYFGWNDERLPKGYPSGWKIKPNSRYNHKGLNLGFLCSNHKQLQYHSSFDWLMKVVDKIESLSFDYAGDKVKSCCVDIRKNYVAISGYTGVRQDYTFYQTPYGFNPDSKIHAVWLAVVQFITWYNTTKH